MLTGLIAVLLSKGLPMVADAIIGKTETEAKKFIKEKTGIDLNSSSYVDELNKPEVLNKLSELDVKMEELQNAREAKKLDSEAKLLELSYEDIANARENYGNVQNSDNATPLSKELPNILSLIITLTFVGLLAGLFYGLIPTDNKDVFYILVGALGTLVNQVFSFHFGSSIGSKNKDKILGARSRENRESDFISDLF